MAQIEDRLHELMDRLDHRENRIQPSDKNLVWEAMQRLRSAYKDVRELQDENEKLKDRLKTTHRRDLTTLAECLSVPTTSKKG